MPQILAAVSVGKRFPLIEGVPEISELSRQPFQGLPNGGFGHGRGGSELRAGDTSLHNCLMFLSDRILLAPEDERRRGNVL